MECGNYIYNVIALVLMVFVSGSMAYVMARFSWIWYVVALLFSVAFIVFLYNNGIDSLAVLQSIFAANPFICVSAVIAGVGMTVGYHVFKNYLDTGESRWSEEERRKYIDESYEAFSKEVEAIRKMITTLATGSFVLIRTLSPHNESGTDFSRVFLFCFISVLFVFAANIASLISLYVSMDRAADFNIEDKDVKACSNFMEHVFLLLAVGTLLTGYWLFASCYVK